ncbi:MAG: M48 family metallopeptidase [Cyclobacteriaceae bacterium]|jgi:STE24 endopeptidase|nr:M48 family metallopeptidase [Cyclobacteriaceae bacterium]
MAAHTLLYILVGLSVAGFVFEQALEWLNLKATRTDIPAEVADYYPAEKYQRSLAYQRDQTRFEFISGGFSFLVSVSFLAGGGFGWLDGILRQVTDNPIGLALLFFGVIVLVSDWLSLPFQWYHTFVLEERYGFNKTTWRTFFLDKAKGYLLGGLVGAALLACLIFLIEEWGPSFWIWFALVAASFMLLMNVFYTSWLLPLFNKLTPLPEGELKTAIEAFARKVNFPLDQVLVMDGSKRSAKANAFFAGLGGRKKIVLYDTLLANHTTEELIAVLAHEVGHYQKKHIRMGYVLSVCQLVLVLFVLSRVVFAANLSFALGGQYEAIHLNLVASGLLFTPVSGAIGLLTNMLSRKNEFEADAYARAQYSGEALARALKKLSVDTLSHLHPHPLYVFFHYSHPPLLQRLRALR